MALHEGTALVAGKVRNTNLDSDKPVRIGDVPILVNRLVDSTELPVGLSERAKTVVTFAVVNAIFAATCACGTHLPITPRAVPAALSMPG